MLDSVEILFAVYLGVFSVLDILLLIWTLVNGARLKIFHLNFRILQLQIIISFLLMSIGNLSYSIMVWLKNMAHDLNDITFIYVQLVMFYGNCSLRPISLAFLIERIYATIQSKEYKKKTDFWLGLFLLIFIHVISMLLLVSCYSWKMNTLIYIGMTIFIDIFCLISVLIVRMWNRKVRQRNLKNGAELTERYQLAENIHAMNFVSPLLLGIIFFNLTAMMFSLISVPTGFMSKYLAMIYYAFGSTLVTFCTLLALVLDTTYREKILYRLPMIRKIIENSEIKKLPNKVTNFEGKKIITIMNEASYFNMLKDSWK